MQATNRNDAAGGAQHERERNAFNLAFGELDLCWHWDEKTYAELSRLSDDPERLHTYLRTRHDHLLKAYDAQFLVDAICSTKARCSEESRAA